MEGAVAQLGERSVRNAEVEGSTPFRSTFFNRGDRDSFLTCLGMILVRPRVDIMRITTPIAVFRLIGRMPLRSLFLGDPD